MSTWPQDPYPNDDAWIEAQMEQEAYEERMYHEHLEREYAKQQEEEYFRWLEEKQNEQDGD
jgi:hypothetical protein